MLSSNLPWSLANAKWASELNPIVNNPLNNAVQISATLKSGNNILNHGLGRVPQGWIITDIQGAASIYRSAPFNLLTLTLNSSAEVSVSIGVF